MKVIIPQPSSQQQQVSWQHALTELITDPKVLLSALALSPDQLPWQWDPQFPLRVSKSFIDRMQKGDPNDPLLKQVLSIRNESQLSQGYSEDPLLEAECNPIPGLLHKFKNRVLLTFTGGCAIHCRFCFRRHFPYAKNNPGKKGWESILKYIDERPDIFEVILSGGDPLLAQDVVIASFLDQLANISHVRLIRFHTRLPVVIPQRICKEFIHVLLNTRFSSILVYHINHPAEITPEIKQGVTELKQAGITVLNQTVLLQDINNNLDCLKTLSLNLFEAGILPYYVHILDPVQGASHFAVTLDQALTLQEQLRAHLPGYLVPKFVKETPKASGKVPLDLLNIPD